MLLTKRFPLLFLFFFTFLFLQNNSVAQPGLYLKVQRVSDSCWGVYVKPVGLNPSSNTITGSGQITLFFPIDFDWGGLMSFNGLWQHSATVVGPPEAPDYQIVSFGLILAEPSYPIQYQVGQETLLFTFCSSDGSCPWSLELITCNTPDPHPFCPPNSVSSNPGNDLSVIDLGFGIPSYYNYGGIYAPNAWSCQDCDGDGIEDAFEDTNGNGIYDPGIDSSDICDPCDPLFPDLIGHLELMGDVQAACADELDSVFLQIILTNDLGEILPDGYGPLIVHLNDSDGPFFSSNNYFLGDSIAVPYTADTTVYQLASIILGQSCEAALDSSQLAIQIPVDGPLNILVNPDDIVDCQSDGYYFYAAAANTFGNQLYYNWQCSQDGNSWVNLANLFPYEGVYNDTLFISDFNGLTGNHYRMAVHSTYCDSVFSEDAILAYDGWLLENFDTVKICEGDSVLLFGNYENGAGNYSGIIPGAVGCDTVLNITLEINPLEEIFETINICEGDSILLFGNYENGAGNYSGIIPGAVGCDTVLNITLEINPLEEIFETINICEGGAVLIFGNYENTAGIYTGIVADAAGCDQLLTVTLEVMPPIFLFEPISICEGDSVLIFGNYETQAGDYNLEIPGPFGCDTLILVILDVIPRPVLSETIPICPGDSIFLFGNYENEPGIYSGIIPSTTGCDTILNVTLELNEFIEKFETINICAGDSIFLFGNYEKDAGIYSGIISGSVGCDTLLNINLEVNEIISSVEYITLCEGDSILLFGNYVTEEGIYTYVSTDGIGCDTFFTVHVYVPDFGAFKSEEITICQGDSALINGNYETQAGFYTFTLPAVEGCDTLVWLSLHVTLPNVYHQTITICRGDSVLIFGKYESEAGIYSQFTDTLECGFVEKYVLKYAPEIELDIAAESSCFFDGTGTLSATVVHGVQPYDFQWSNGWTGANISGLLPGDYTLTVTDAQGCVASQSITVEAIPPVNFVLDVMDATCSGSAGAVTLSEYPNGALFSLDGLQFSSEPMFSGLSAGTYDFYLLGEDGCISEQTFEVQQPLGFTLYLPDDVTIDLGDSVRLASQVSSLDSMTYYWSPAGFLDCETCPAPWAAPYETTYYTLTATDENDCTETEGITVFVNKKENVFVPNAFSPNGDGINDLLTVFADPSIRQIKQFLVFDRWGDMVFQNNDFPPNEPSVGWDGKFRGKPMDTAVFAWMVVVEKLDGQEELLKGNVHLIK